MEDIFTIEVDISKGFNSITDISRESANNMNGPDMDYNTIIHAYQYDPTAVFTKIASRLPFSQ